MARVILDIECPVFSEIKKKNLEIVEVNFSSDGRYRKKETTVSVQSPSALQHEVWNIVVTPAQHTLSHVTLHSHHFIVGVALFILFYYQFCLSPAC